MKDKYIISTKQKYSTAFMQIANTFLEITRDTY